MEFNKYNTIVSDPKHGPFYLYHWLPNVHQLYYDKN